MWVGPGCWGFSPGHGPAPRGFGQGKEPIRDILDIWLCEEDGRQGSLRGICRSQAGNDQGSDLAHSRRNREKGRHCEEVLRLDRNDLVMI